MKTLLLMRHAKSSWDQPELADRERPLNKRGLKDAPNLGRVLKKKDIIPDRVLTSTAVRAAQTADLVAEKVHFKGEVTYLDSYYLAEPDAYLVPVRELPEEVKTVLIVGHNPGIEGLLQILSRKVESMPTAALARISLPIDSWKDLTLETKGKLKDLWLPRDLK
jgi:phosphohistidine phosphatase